MTKRKLFRWKAIVPLTMMVVLVTVGWWLFIDTIVARSVEVVGTAVVGARVDVAEADVRLREGFLSLRGLQVTNPDRPMTNLIQAEEIIAEIRIRPLLAKKVFVDTLVVRDVRFGTPRETSGAVEEPSELSRTVRAQVDTWAGRVAVPPFSLEGLGAAVNVGAMHPDSLRMLGAVALLTGQLDSSRNRLVGVISAANPSSTITAGRTLLDSLNGKTVRDLGVQGALTSVRTARDLVAQIDRQRARLAALDDSVLAVAGDAAVVNRTLQEFRDRDLAYARGLFKIPSLDAPDLAPSLLGEFAVGQVRPILYWLGVAERFIPPGLDPRRRAGPRRARRAGTTVEFPSVAEYPAFTVAFAEAAFTTSTGAAAGTYQARLQNLTTSPAALGLPLELRASRVAAPGAGAVNAGVAALFDHTGIPLRDSVAVNLDGVTLPSIAIPGLGTRLHLDNGRTALAFQRRGDSVTGRLMWSSQQVSWVGTGPATGIVAGLSSVVEEIDAVEIEVRFAGRITSPRLSVRSNLGSALSAAVRARLAGEVARAEATIRAEIDRRVEAPLRDYRARATGVRDELHGRVASHRQSLDQLKADLEARIRELTRGLPPGIGRQAAGAGAAAPSGF